MIKRNIFKNYKIRFMHLILAFIFIFTGNVLFAQKNGPKTDIKTTNILTGKTVWIIDVNTNEDYKSFLQAALIDQLPQFATGVIVRHVITQENSNPFFLLKQEDYPHAVIISLALCTGTSKDVANYASEARKKDIRLATVNTADVRKIFANWNKTYHNIDIKTIEIEKFPASQEEAMKMAKLIIPLFIKGLKK